MKSFQFSDGDIVGGVTLLYGESDIVDPQYREYREVCVVMPV